MLLRKNATAPPRPDGLKNSEEYRVAQDQVMQEIESGSELDFSHDRVMSFAKDTLSETVASLRRGEAPGPSVTFLPGWHTKDGEERLGHVSVKAAFESPETREACGQFLCKYAADYRAHAAVLVVARKDVAFPQVWRRNGWTMGNIGGWFVQLESEAARRVWFIPVPKVRA